jgi:glycosyltransferase involved in cell wall biosynthesis/O-antigen ligase
MIGRGLTRVQQRLRGAWDRSFCGSVIEDGTPALAISQSRSYDIFRRIGAFFSGKVRGAIAGSAIMSAFGKMHILLFFALVALAPFLPTMVCVGLALLTIVSSFAAPRESRGGSLSFLIAMFILISALYAFTSVAPVGSVKVWAVYAVFIIMYFMTLRTIKDARGLAIMANTFVASGILVSLYGIYQQFFGNNLGHAWLDEEMFTGIAVRVYSTLENPNVLGEYLLLTIPMSVALLWNVRAYSGRLKRVFAAAYYIFGTGAMLLCMIFTQSRGCWLALVVSALIYVIFIDKRLLALFFIALAFVPSLLPQSIIDRFASIGDLSDSSTSYRVFIWFGTLNMLGDFWAYGIGLGAAAWAKIYPFYSYSMITAPHAHNVYLQVISEMGIVGLTVFVGIIVVFFGKMLRAYVRTKRGVRTLGTLISVAAMAGVAGFLMQGAFDYVWYNYRVFLMFWVALGIGAAAVRVQGIDDGNTAEASSGKRKLVHIISDTNIGGAGRYLLQFLKECSRDKYDVAVILPRGSQLKAAIEREGAEVREVDGLAEKSFSFKAVSEIAAILREMGAGKADSIVHTHGALSGRIAAKLVGAGLVVYTRHSVFEQSAVLTSAAGRIINKIVNSLTADKIIAVAEAAKKNLVDTGVPSRKICVIYNGVTPLERVDASEKKAQFAEKYGLRDNCPTLAIIARLTEVKGQRYVIEAAKILRDRGVDAQFIIAGTGEEKDALKELAEKLDVLDGNVFIPGFIRDVEGLMNIIDIQINASHGTEAASLSLLEGMSIGLPAIVSDYGGNTELIEDGVNGIVTRRRDPEGIANAVEKLLNDEALYSSMRVDGKRIFDERFTAKTMVRNMENFYENRNLT